MQLARDLGVRPSAVVLKDLDHAAVDLVQDLVLRPGPDIDVVASFTGGERGARPSRLAWRAVYTRPRTRFLRPHLDGEGSRVADIRLKTPGLQLPSLPTHLPFLQLDGGSQHR